MLDWLDRACQQNEMEPIFAYEKCFDDSGHSWCENTWSNVCVAFLIQVSLKMDLTKYTASDGNLIHHDQRVIHFIFHGSPDITIEKMFPYPYLCCLINLWNKVLIPTKIQLFK